MIVVKNVIYHGTPVSFTVEGVGIHALLFGDKEDKSMWMALLSGQDEPEAGEVSLFRKDTEASLISQKRHIGYVPSALAVYGDMTVREFLDFIGEAKGVAPDKRIKQIKEAMELTGIADVANRLLGSLSSQKCRRVAFAQAVLGNPSVILCDEPFADADREQQRVIGELLRLLGRHKPIVLGSLDTEILSLCTSATVLFEDGIRFAGDAAALLSALSAKKAESVERTETLATLAEYFTTDHQKEEGVS
jgi:ABC-2 type transport system ATP-binding protein